MGKTDDMVKKKHKDFNERVARALNMKQNPQQDKLALFKSIIARGRATPR